MKDNALPLFDVSAIGLSGLCLVHCLALPVLAAFLPMFGAWSHAEWVHLVFAAIAVPLTGLALWRAHRRRSLPVVLRLLAVTGLAGLVAGAFGPEAMDTPVTVAGSLMLATAHVWNWSRRPFPHAACAPAFDHDACGACEDVSSPAANRP